MTSRLSRPRRTVSLLLIAAVVSLIQADSFALIRVGRGNRPIKDHGWPMGTLDVANLHSRLMWWEGPPFGGGEYHFLYCSKDTEEFNHALRLFEKIRTPTLELIVHDGPERSHWIERDAKSKDEARIDWSFTVWVPENWHRLYNNPTSITFSDNPNFRRPVAPPRIDVYIGGGSITWGDVKVPDNVTLIDRRADSAPVKPVGGGLFRANVYDMATGKPVPDAEISVMQFQPSRNWKVVANGKSDANGACTIERIPPGTYEIHVHSAGYAPRKAGRYRNRTNTYHELNIELSKRSCISGIVLDAEGNPIKDVTVRVMALVGIDGRGYPCPQTPATTTDAEGRFRFGELPAGFADLSCRGDGLYQAKPGTFHIHDIPSENIVITMAATGSIHVKIIDRSGKADFKNIHVHVDPVSDPIGKWGGSAKCQNDGTFTFSQVPPGEYRVRTTPRTQANGKDPGATIIRVHPARTTKVEIIHR